MTQLRTPVRLGGRYQLGALLGAGGTAQVHRGTDLVLGRPVAVKVFRPDVEFHDAARVEAEGRTLAALNHPGLVAVYDAGVSPSAGGEVRFLVMELIDGPSLASAAGSLTTEEVARLGSELGEALAHVHEHAIIHRDIKPANVLIDKGGRAKITDFGIARLIDSARRTATGLTIGTAAYLSPEQIAGTDVGPASDVYSLGLVLLECLTGRREYPGTGTESALARLNRSPNIPVSLPAPWPVLLAAMTATDAALRPTAADVAAALRQTPRPSDLRATAGEATTTAVLTSKLPLEGLGGPDPVTTRLAPHLAGARRAAADGITEAITVRQDLARRTLREPRKAARRIRSARASLAAAVALAVALAVTGAVLNASGGRSPAPTPVPASGSLFARDLSDLNKAVTP